MAIGDSDDTLQRTKDLIPGGWFRSVAFVRDAVLGGLADSLSWIFSLIQAVAAQTRIGTASGWFLDLISWDFFGPNLLRQTNELDPAYRARIRAEIMRERVTRAGIIKGLKNLTGREPSVFDPPQPVNSMCYGAPTCGYGVPTRGYGSLSTPNQIFVTAFRPALAPQPGLAGFGAPQGGFGAGAFAYGDSQRAPNVLTDAAIEAVVDSTVAAGVQANLGITD